MYLFIFVKAGNSVNDVFPIVQLQASNSGFLNSPWTDCFQVYKGIGITNSSVLGSTSAQTPEEDSFNTFFSGTTM